MLIAFTGHFLAGKDTAAKAIMEDSGLDFHHVNFADPMRKIAGDLFGIHKECFYDQDLKATPLNQYPFSSPREILQKLGSEAIRNVWPDAWVHAWKNASRGFKHVIVSDLRFQNEADLVREMQGTLIRIRRPATDKPEKHISEVEQDRLKVDYTIINDGSIEDLQKNAVSLFRTIAFLDNHPMSVSPEALYASLPEKVARTK